jgi:serine/threonine protein kinase
MGTESNSSNREARLHEAIKVYLKAVSEGNAPDRQNFISTFPDIAAGLEAFFASREPGRDLRAPDLSVATSPHCATSEEAPTIAPRDMVIDETDARCRFFGDYELLEEINRGAMGVVFKARQISLNRIVALKMILAGQLASAADVQRFRREAEAAAQLAHPNIAPIYEVGEFEGQHYFTMKFIDGCSLAQQMTKDRRTASSPTSNLVTPLSGSLQTGERDSQIAHLLIKVSRAVHYAHQRGILHRDLKPGNILLDGEGEPYVVDFGLAKHVAGHECESGEALTQTGAIVGTPQYMAPEQASAQKTLSTAVDVYSLCAILYEL